MFILHFGMNGIEKKKIKALVINLTRAFTIKEIDLIKS